MKHEQGTIAILCNQCGAAMLYEREDDPIIDRCRECGEAGALMDVTADDLVMKWNENRRKVNNFEPMRKLLEEFARPADEGDYTSPDPEELCDECGAKRTYPGQKFCDTPGCIYPRVRAVLAEVDKAARHV